METIEYIKTEDGVTAAFVNVPATVHAKDMIELTKRCRKLYGKIVADMMTTYINDEFNYKEVKAFTE